MDAEKVFAAFEKLWAIVWTFLYATVFEGKLEAPTKAAEEIDE